jgi:hypothetical protein
MLVTRFQTLPIHDKQKRQSLTYSRLGKFGYSNL